MHDRVALVAVDAQQDRAGLEADSATPKLLSTSAFDVPPDKYDSSTMTSNVASAALNAAASAYVVVYVGVANAKSAASVTAVRPAAVQSVL